jgi:hypothetical protein
LTLGASATYSLILSLMQPAFEKIIKRKNFSTVLDMQVYTSLVATVVSLVGLFASGEWKTLEGEMLAFPSGKISYITTLMWTAISWQVTSVRSDRVDLHGVIPIFKCDKHTSSARNSSFRHPVLS